MLTNHLRGSKKMKRVVWLLGLALILVGSAGCKNKKLLVTLVGENKVAIIDTKEGKLLGKVAVGGQPHDVICSFDGKWAYVTNPTTSDLTVIDVANAKPHKTIKFADKSLPWHVEISPDGSKVYVALQHANKIAVIDAKDYSVTYVNTPSEHPGPWAISAPKGTSKVYVTFNGSIPGGTANTGSRVGVFDSSNLSAAFEMINVGKGPHGLIAAPDGSAVFTTAQVGHEVWKIDVATSKAKKFASIAGEAAPAPGFPTDVAVSPNGKLIISGNHDIDSVSLINASTGSIIHTLATGSSSLPWGAIFDSDSKMVYIANNGTKNVAFYNTDTKEVEKNSYHRKRPRWHGLV